MTDTETKLKFSELSESAKDKARRDYTGEGYMDYEWWDNVFEDAVRMAAILGIQISKTRRGKMRDGVFSAYDHDISFSGFSSQGDGASFEGWYTYAPDAVTKIAAETNDAELLRIATELYVLQLARRMSNLEYFTATIKTSGRYSHSNTMDITTNSEDEDDEHCQVSEDLEDSVTQLMRDFADWIYEQLEAEHDYLYSDECVDQYLEEKDFDEDGSEL